MPNMWDEFHTHVIAHFETITENEEAWRELRESCGVSSALQLQQDSLCRFLGLFGECAQNSQTLHKTRQNTATTTRITERVEKRVKRYSNTRSSAAGDQDHQPQCITGLVNEQESQ